MVPEIQPSSDLRNKYNELSQLCHKSGMPMNITRNGEGDLASMSIETYENLTEKFELYSLFEVGF